MFSLIVCTVDRNEHLKRLFVSLQQQTFRQFEVILVDQNEDDRLVSLVETFAADFLIRHIRSKRGLSRARNVGITASRTDLIAFPDDDCWYTPDTLSVVHALFTQDPALRIVTGRTLDAQGQPSVSPTGLSQCAISRDNFLSCGNSNGIFIRSDLLKTIGHFDEQLGVGAQTPFQSGEEADLLLRAIASGAKLIYFPQVTVHHDQVVGQDNPKRIERAAKYGAGFGALLRKHDFSLSYFGWRIARPLLGAGLALLRLNPAEARYKLAWLSGIWHGYWAWNTENAARLPDTSR
ncbi:glycosyltransferase family A protein [Rhizobium sp.]|uniref:glycosyltransferase family 2 protein n=1 Tax=Rhizobium sp. TaxID=391 RepID=UPI000E8A3149|nr:glycosyl transferase [Rhizobium sp.]